MHIDPQQVRLEATWKEALLTEFQQDYFLGIKQALLDAKARGITVYPPNHLIFKAFEVTPLPQVRAVILGQDPYHQPGQAMGLSFSVPRGEKIPPSLRNVYQELTRTVAGFTAPQHGDLSAWAAQGVLLLNSSLTVEASRAGSHSKIGWQHFTDAVIRTLSQQKQGLIFMLWGNFAKAKSALIDAQRHTILTAAHPSPLAGKAFIGCNHFQLCNAALIKQGQPPIDWRL